MSFFCARLFWPWLALPMVYENDRRAPDNLRVELLSAYGSIVETRTTDGLGSVIFPNVVAGKYQLRVTGLEIATVQTESFDIGDMEPSHTEYVRVRTNKPGVTPSAGDASVSATDLKIPTKAKAEFEKGAARLAVAPPAGHHHARSLG